MGIDPRDLQERPAGHVPHHDEWNALVRSANKRTSLINGVDGRDYSAEYDVRKSIVRPVYAYTANVIPPYSIFGVLGIPPQKSSEYITECTIEKIGFDSGGAMGTPYTNGPDDCDIGWNWVFPIGAFSPVTLRVGSDSAHDLPKVGDFCGPMIDTWGLSRRAQGFVCLCDSEGTEVSEGGAAGSYSSSGGAGGGGSGGGGGGSGISSGSSGGTTGTLVKVIRCPEPKNILCKITSQITASNLAGVGDAAVRTLGKGRAKILWRDPADSKLKDAPNPATGETPWEVDIFSRFDKVHSVGRTVEVASVLGVGLLLQPLDAPASYIQFALPGPMAASDGVINDADVLYFTNGSDPGETVTLHNMSISTGGFLFSGTTGQRGYADYDDKATELGGGVTNIYRIKQMEC